MIIPKPKHYFEATYPVLEEGEEIIWYRHPEHPLSCNQLGMVFFDDDIVWCFGRRNQYRYNVKGNPKFFILGSEERVICECLTGISYKGKAFLYKDGNPYNKTLENLLPYKSINTDELKDANNRWREFVNASVDYMNSRKPLIEKRGIDPAEYWSLMELPDWLIKRWSKGTPMPKSRIRKKSEQERPPRPGGYVVNPWKLEKAALIHKLHDEGLSQKRIAELVGLKSNSGVVHWLKKYPKQK